MLKIKDNVDLKELEKFGFTAKVFLMGYEEYVLISKTLISKDHCAFVDYNTRELKILPSYYDIPYVMEVLFSLVQANLVEKIE